MQVSKRTPCVFFYTLHACYSNSDLIPIALGELTRWVQIKQNEESAALCGCTLAQWCFELYANITMLTCLQQQC